MHFPERLARLSEMNDQAQKCYQQALQIEPNNPDALIGLARLHNGMGDQARAVAAYHKAIQRLPKQAALGYDVAVQDQTGQILILPIAKYSVAIVSLVACFVVNGLVSMFFNAFSKSYR